MDQTVKTATDVATVPDGALVRASVSEQRTTDRDGASTAPTALLVGAAGGLIQVTTAIAGLFIARGLGIAQYGEVAYFFSVFGMVVLIGSLGLSTQVTTEAARLVGIGTTRSRSGKISILLEARLVTVAVLDIIAALVAIQGDRTAAVAVVAGSVALLTGFGFGIVQGLGGARLVAGLQLTQALLYLGTVALWASVGPGRVFATVIGTYTISFLGTIVACRQLLATAIRSRWHIGETLRAIIPLTGPVYFLTLLLAPYGGIAVLTLGKAGAFESAAEVSVALALTGPLSGALATIIGAYYYPHLCALVARDAPTCREFYEGFYRPIAALGILATIILAVFPAELISILYGPRYLAGVATLRAMAPAAGFLAVGQLMVWTLWSHGQVRCALAGAFVQLVVLLAAVALAVSRPTVPLWWLGLGHSLAAASGVAVWSIGLRRLGRDYRWHVRRLTVTTGSALAVAALLQRALAALETNRLTSAMGLVVATLLVGALVAGLAVPFSLRPTRARP